MKLQKLLKKLALPVFALVVVSMLAACSSPSGGGSDSGNGNGNGGKTDNPPALEDTTEYGIDLGSLTTEQQAALKAVIEAAGGTVGQTMTGAEIEELKEELSEAGYTYSEENGTVTIEKKPAPSSGSEGKGEYTIMYENLVLGTCDKKTFDEMSTNAGTKNGNIVTMSSAYITQTLTRKNEDKGKEYVAVIFYGNDEPGFLEQEDLQRIENLLEKNTDYKISSDKKVIVITESGLVKYSGASTVFVDTDITDAPLFNVSELTVAADKISWTEGTWLFKEIAEYSDGRKKFETDKIQAGSSGIKYTEMISTQTGTVTESMPKAQFDMLTAAGKIKGNQYTYTIKASEDDIAEENERIVRSFNRSISDLKTNADKTKYYWEYSEPHSDGKSSYTKKYYLEKKSGTSTPVTLPESSNDDNHGSSQSGTSVPSGTTVPSSFNGKYSGKVSGNGSKGFVEYSISVEISDGHYSVKLVEDSEEAVEPYFTASGNLSLYTGSSSSTNLTGTGSDHLFSATLYEDSEDNEWDVTVQLTSGFAYKGTMKDVYSGKGSDSSDKPAVVPEGTGTDSVILDKEYIVIKSDGGASDRKVTGAEFKNEASSLNLIEGKDYTVNNSQGIINLTATGTDKLILSYAKDDDYIIYYKDHVITVFGNSSFEGFVTSAGLTSDDYEVNKVYNIELSDSGYQKYQVWVDNFNKTHSGE